MNNSSAAPTASSRLTLGSGLAYVVIQLVMMVGFAVLILPLGGSPDAPPLEHGAKVLQVAERYRLGNFLMLLPAPFLLVFLGGAYTALRRSVGSEFGLVAALSGTLVALIWPLSAILHDVALDTARFGTDLRILAGEDAIAPYALALSAVFRAVLLFALALGARAERSFPRLLAPLGMVVAALGLVGSGVLVSGGLFPVLALSTLLFELWLGAWCLFALRAPQPRRAAIAQPA